jgi:apolipoprotein N-acyltransferase
MATAGVARTLLAAAAGAATVFGFAPFDLPGVAVVTFALLMTLWLHASPRSAACSGFAFGLGLFGAGASWVYVALNTFGGMPLLVAATGTAIWTAYLALFPALTGWLATRFTAAASLPRALAAAAIWTLAEMFRGSGYTGFPWLVLGYAQLPPDGAASPLAGYATLGGVWLVTLAVTLAGSALALAVDAFATPARMRGLALLVGAAAIAGGGFVAAGIEWTAPAGAPVAVSLVQGNVPQDTKFDPNLRDETFRLYADLVSESRGRLVVLPESAFPVFADEVPNPVLLHLLRTAKARNGDVLAGLFTAEPPLPGRDEPRYYNSVVSLGTGDTQLYRKRHLVPFGETIPLEFLVGWFIRSVLAIPLAEQTPGDRAQPPMAVAGQRVAVNICYEDAFGGELRGQAESATLLVNVTNDAWYGRSLAAVQHNQIAAMRALETGRPLLRATNTGITSAIDHRGHEIARLPWFTRGILELEIAGRQGVTPYVRWGEAVTIALAALLLVAAAVIGRGSGRARISTRLP